MPEKQLTNDLYRPLLGWVSIGIAVLVFLLPDAFIWSQITLRAQKSEGNGSVAGGVAEWALYCLLAMIAAGALSAAIGLLMGERPRWVHAAGVVLNLAAPAVALATLRLMYG
jgi:hypothetical protein